MKKVSFFFCFFMLFTSIAQAQHQEQIYDSLIQKADDLYRQKAYSESAKNYGLAFQSWGKGYPGDRYNAACSYALSQQPDSAFAQLNIIANKSKYSNLDHITKDKDLVSLYSDKRWKPLIKTVKSNQKVEQKDYNKKLMKELETIFDDDQIHRQKIGGLYEQYGRKSPQVDSIWEIIEYYDSINLIKVCKLLDKHGWVGPNVVGGKGNSAIFLVIQHASLATQQKYLPLMREAAAKGNARNSSLALLEDRVALGEGRNQLYGSQIGYDESTQTSYVLPLEKPDEVDALRQSMGLGTLNEYCKYFGFEWNLEHYKEQLPYYQSLQKK